MCTIHMLFVTKHLIHKSSPPPRTLELSVLMQIRTYQYAPLNINKGSRVNNLDLHINMYQQFKSRIDAHQYV